MSINYFRLGPNQSPIWPGVQRGDIWHHTKLKLPTGKPGSDLIPFHKLSQWLCYSIMEPMEQILDIKFTETDSLTALPEYRNAGLLLDHGVLQLRDPSLLDGRGISVEHEAVEEKLKNISGTYVSPGSGCVDKKHFVGYVELVLGCMS